MKEFIIQLEVHVSLVDESDGDHQALEEFGASLSNFSTYKLEKGWWRFAYDGPEALLLDQLILRVIDDLPDVETVMKLESVEKATISVGVLTDSYVTSVSLAPETINAIAEKLNGVGLEIMIYPTDFSEDEAPTDV